MKAEEIERIKSAYYSGLKVQIWSCGNWIDFDAREYPYGGFSTKRQYRIVGSEYVEKAEAEIKRLENECSKMQKKNEDLTVEIAKLKECLFNTTEDLEGMAKLFVYDLKKLKEIQQ